MLIFVHRGLLHAMAAEVGNEDRHIPCKGKILLFVELGLCSELFCRIAKDTPFANLPIRYPGLLGSVSAEFGSLVVDFAGRVPWNSVRFAIVCVCVDVFLQAPLRIVLRFAEQLVWIRVPRVSEPSFSLSLSLSLHFQSVNGFALRSGLLRQLLSR